NNNTLKIKSKKEYVENERERRENYDKRTIKNNSFHRTNTHSDNESLAQNKDRTIHPNNKHNAYKNTKNAEKKSHNDNKILAVKEPIPNIKFISIPIRIAEKKFSALLDTGSIYNYISDKELKNIRTYKELTTNQKIIEIANGIKTQKNTFIELEVIIFGNSHSKMRDSFYVLDGLNNVFLLGMGFIHKNKLILDMKNNILNIDGTEYEMDDGEKKLLMPTMNYLKIQKFMI
ncbi:hypothetical protein DMUE_5669, partial [Dictyocoela muelleri]